MISREESISPPLKESSVCSATRFIQSNGPCLRVPQRVWTASTLRSAWSTWEKGLDTVWNALWPPGWGSGSRTPSQAARRGPWPGSETAASCRPRLPPAARTPAPGSTWSSPPWALRTRGTTPACYRTASSPSPCTSWSRVSSNRDAVVVAIVNRSLGYYHVGPKMLGRTG